MKKIILLILSFCSVISYAQDKKVIGDFSTDDKGQIYYSEVIPVENVSKQDLYVKSKTFFAETFKSANDVIQMEDKDSGVIIGKGSYKLSSMNPLTIYLNYNIKIQSKDGRFKYEIYNFTTNGETGHSPLEVYFTEDFYYKKNGQPKPVNLKIKDDVLNIINSLIESIKNNMAKTVTNDEKW